VELVVVIALVAILSSFAIPAYTNYVKKAYRADMAAALFEVAGEAERKRMARLDNSYTGADSVIDELFGTNGRYREKLGDKYNVDLVLTNSDTAYYISAIPRTDGTQNADGALALSNGSVCHYGADSISVEDGVVTCNGDGDVYLSP